jgi:hypothetical protein
LSLLFVWLLLAWVGFAAMFWASGTAPWRAALRESGSALMTLGFAAPHGALHTLLAFAEAATGLTLIALLIAYLPGIYGAFARSETAVKLLEVRAGSPPSAIEMLSRFHRIHGWQALGEQWHIWESWFADVDESHTSLAALVFFRSPRPQHSWLTAAGAVLDAASLARSTIDIPADPRADLCIRAGYLALRHITATFRHSYPADPHYPAQPISVTREEYDAACEVLAAAGIPLKADRDQAWLDFAGWRVNYDEVLLTLCRLIVAPPAPWSSDRA